MANGDIYINGVLDTLNMLHWKLPKIITGNAGILDSYGTDVLTAAGLNLIVVWDKKSEKYITKKR